MAKQWTSSDLREIITLQESTTVTTSGEDAVTWDTVSGAGSIRASVREEKEYERIRAGRNEGKESVVIVTRKGLPVTPKNRFLWRDNKYQVVGFAESVDVRRLWIRFTGVRTDAA